ncbi:MAG: hypothetical protein PHS14_08615 [Elusimicrobia bacterium]|nr:hypothetical protein [Elusimicrobiota bacterium]
MIRRDFQAMSAAGLLALLACACVQSKLPRTSGAGRVDAAARASAPTPEETILLWPAPAQRLAGAMLEKYGPPTRFDGDALIWLHNGPWEKTVAYRDHLKQVIGYRVPNDKIEPLLSFDPRVEADQNTNELSARSGSERVNFLLLNLADDIVTEKRTAAEARAFYAMTLRLEAAGKSSSYLEAFLFEPPNEKTVTP